LTTTTTVIAMTRTTPDLLSQALEFRTLMGQPIGTTQEEILELQSNLIFEEFYEFFDAFDVVQSIPRSDEASADALKELADLVYVCFQFAAAIGWELDEALDRVHKSNLSKLVDGKPLRREDGKILKGPDYQPPYLSDLV
jgi:predicted HAD superfamily Cof-like phosphohydrolase